MPKFIIPKGYSILIPHTHTTESDGMVSPEELTDAAAKLAHQFQAKIFLAITDHDTIKGVEKAKKHAQKYPKSIEIITGEEITAGFPFYQKHIVALNIEKPIAHSKSIGQTIDEIKKQKGLVVIPHPHVSGIPVASLTFTEIGKFIQLIDGIEVTSISPLREKKIDIEFKKLNVKIARIGSPDSHYGSFDLVSSFSIFKGKTFIDFQQAFSLNSLKPAHGPHNFPSYSTWLRQKLIALGTLGIRRYLLGNLN